MSERIQKFLSNLGYGSRREVEEWITEGRLVVNGAAAEIGQKIGEEDAVKLDGKRLSLKSGNEPLRVLLYKKRTGEMVTREDPEGRRTVFRKLPDLETGRWIAVGRLDVNTSGLLLMTNHGELARRLMHPSFEQRREYAVRALGEVREDAFAQLREGVELEDGQAHFESIRFGDNEIDDDEEDGEGGGSRANRWFVVTISEGRHREVRRLFESQGLTVNRLIRTAYGPIQLGRGIKSGGYREATADEMRKLLDAVGLDHAEMLPEKVRASHRAKSEYSASGPLSNRAGKKPRAEGPKPAFKSGADGWGRADAKERRSVERSERRERFERPASRDEASRPRFAKPVRAGGSERPAGARPWQEKSAAPTAGAWASTRKPRPATPASEHTAEGDEPQQFKARGFGARSERSYQERGDRAPASPTRAYRGASERAPGREPSRDRGNAWAKPASDRPRAGRDGDTRRPDGARPYERAPARARPGEGERRAPSRPARAEGQRPYRSDGERPAFKPRSDSSRYGDRPREGERPYGARKSFEPRGDAPRGVGDGRPAFKPRFKTPDREGPRGGARPGARDGDRGSYRSSDRAGPRDGDRPRRPAGDRPPPRKSGPLQRFAVKEGKAAPPGKPRLGLRSPRPTDKDKDQDD